jgi:Tol biopolymer transport system component
MDKIWILALSACLTGCSGIPENSAERNIVPPMFPDITDVTVPVNIAPLNFRISAAEKTVVSFEDGSGKHILKGSDKIKIPGKTWRKMLERSAGKELIVTLWSKEKGSWYKYLPFKIFVKEEPIDRYLVYRRIAPGYESWSDMGIYQRDLESFSESTIIDNRLLPGNCMNCHSFNHNNPDQMMFHLRGNIGATMLVRNGVIEKLNTKTKEIGLNCVYPYWHPSGSFIAFSVNSISQVFHSTREKRIEVMDSKSDIVVFDINSDKLITSKLISTEESLETFPVFSADGKTLYFCTAKKMALPDNYDRIKYSLCSIAFDASSGTFGKTVDTLVSSNTTGKSISFPRTSHDGRYLMFTMAEYGNFSIWHRDADLWLLNMADGQIKPLQSVNSTESDSYHSWSSGSHWFVFASRRSDGLYTRPYFAWIGDNGETTKPFMLPQENPDFYDYCLHSFNVPELVTGKVTADGRKMLRTIGSEAKSVTFEVKE